jgi:hypothetical protein
MGIRVLLVCTQALLDNAIDSMLTFPPGLLVRLDCLLAMYNVRGRLRSLSLCSWENIENLAGVLGVE